MRRPRYTLYDTDTRRYLREAVQPDGDPDQLYTHWTNVAAKALRFPGVKSARRMAERLSSYRGEILIKNARGEIIP